MMKITKLILPGLILCLFACSFRQAMAAGDPLKVTSGMYKLLYENDRIRVMEVTFNPGQKIAPHSHPDHFVTVLNPGTIAIYKPDGSSSVNKLTTEQIIWIPAETHWAENTGKTKIRLLVTELKTPASALDNHG